MRRLLAGLVIMLPLAPLPAAGQVPVVVTGAAGATFDIDDRDPESGGGFSVLTGIGLRLSRLTIGAEFGRHSVGNDRKARQYGAFVRLPARTSGRVRPYFVLGLADYRYSPAFGGKTHAIGGSVGPGVLLSVASSHVHLLLEARFHTSFDRIGTISSQEYLGITAGVGFSL